MSKTTKEHVQVRIPADVAHQVQNLAGAERRSFTNMVEVLLLRQLEPVRADPENGRVRPHMKKNRPAVECPTRWPSGVCPDCGQTIT